MIEIKNVTKYLGGKEILSDVSFCADKGKIFGLIGYNGVGKTTLLKICAGIYKAEKGEVLIDGKPVYENPSVKKHCFFMTEEATFFDQASLQDMRNFYRKWYPSWSDATYKGLIDWFGLDSRERISTFSKGMQRQASLTLALSCRTEYLFLDEAFDGLDHSLRFQVREMLAWYAKKRDAAIIITTHNLKELESLADEVGMINYGHYHEVHAEPDHLEDYFVSEREIKAIDWEEVFI